VRLQNPAGDADRKSAFFPDRNYFGIMRAGREGRYATEDGGAVWIRPEPLLVCATSRLPMTNAHLIRDIIFRGDAELESDESEADEAV
jgi:hypothetical protein